MKNLTELKLSLAKRILDSEDEDQLLTVDQVLGNGGSLKLSAKQKAELDADFADYKNGKGSSYTWAEVKAHAKRASRHGA